MRPVFVAALVIPLTSVTLALISCSARVSSQPIDPNRCYDVRVELLRHPTAAMAFEWGENRINSGHQWGTVHRSGDESRIVGAEDFIPSGSPMSTTVKGLSFNMLTHMRDISSEGEWVRFV
jgi:hypothetical protein